MRLLSSPYFTQRLSELDAGEARRVSKTLAKLESSSAPIGKKLAPPLQKWRSIPTGHNDRLRIVFRYQQNDVQLLTLGPRSKGSVYKEANDLRLSLKD